MPRALAAALKTEGRGAINPAAIWRATPASTTSVRPKIAPTTVRARDCSIRHRTMIRRRTITATITTTSISIPTISAATTAATATTPERFPTRKRKRPLEIGRPFLFQIIKNSDHDDLCADIDAAVQIDHVLIAHPDAAGRDVGADCPRFVGAVNAIERRSQIHRACAERVLRAAFHVPRQIGAPRQHFRWRRPCRPFLLRGNLLDARPGESGTTDPDAVAHGLAVALYQEQKFVRRIDDNRAGSFAAVIVDELLLESRIECGICTGDFLLAHDLLRLHRREQRTLIV